MSLDLERDHDVVVACLDEPGLWAEQLRRAGLTVYSCWRQPGLDFSMARRLSSIIATHEISIVHAHQYTPWFYSALARLFCSGTKLIFEEHGRFYPEIDNWRRRWANKILISRLTHRIVAVSTDIRERLVRYEGLDRETIDVIHNGIPVPTVISDVDRTALRTSLGFTGRDFVVGTVGRLDPIKNLPMFIDSVAKASQSFEDVRGLIIGDGIEYNATKSRIESLHLGNRVRMTGFRDDATDLIQCLDLFVLPSFSEGTSIALLEAMACGVPAAVTDVGGNPELVVADSSGWVVPSDSVDDLYSAIAMAVSNSSKAKNYSETGQRRYLEEFSFDKMMDRYRNIYNELLS